MEVSVCNVSKSFRAVRAVDDVSCAFRGGEIFGLLGPNGAGKTTLIRMMLDILRPDDGSIAFNGKTISKEIQNRIGYLPEERGLYKKQKIGEMLEYIAILKGLTLNSARKKTKELLDLFGLSDAYARKTEELSKGNQQKIQIIASLIHEPELVMFDEPFAGLDPVNTRLIKDILLGLKAQGKTVILSTHQMGQVEELCGWVVMIDKGKTVLNGALRDIRRDFSKGAILVDNDAPVDALPSVLRVENAGAKKKIFLKNGATTEDFLRSALEANILLAYFEVAATPLEDIFVQIAKSDGGSENAVS